MACAGEHHTSVLWPDRAHLGSCTSAGRLGLCRARLATMCHAHACVLAYCSPASLGRQQQQQQQGCDPARTSGIRPAAHLTHTAYIDTATCAAACLQEFCDTSTLSSLAVEWQAAGAAPTDRAAVGAGDAQMLERLGLLADVARGLQYLHDQGIIHGELVSGVRSPVRVGCAAAAARLLHAHGRTWARTSADAGQSGS
jgi:hypothetical protein